MSMGFYRSVIIGLIYLAYAWPRREALLPKGKAKTYLIVSSQLKTISNALLIYILSKLDVSLAMVMYACIFPMFSLVMTRLANPVKDKLTKGRIAGCILGGIAAGLMAFKGDPSLSTFLFIIIMLMCFTAALHVLIECKAIEHGATQTQSMLAVTLYSAPGYLVLALIFGESLTAGFSNTAGIWAFTISIIIGTWHFISRRAFMGMSQMSGYVLISSLPFVVSILVSVLFLGEQLNDLTILGIVIVPIALWIGRLKKKNDPNEGIENTGN